MRAQIVTKGHTTMDNMIYNNYVTNHYNCAEALLLTANDTYQLGLSQESIKLVSAFGGGMGIGGTCGALVGALSVLGQIYVEKKESDAEGFRELCGEFATRFQKEFGSLNCSDIKPTYHKDETNRCIGVLEKTWNLLHTFLIEKGKVAAPETEVTVTAEQITRVKALGFLHNKGTNNFNGRVITVNGKLTAAQMKCVSEAAELFGNGQIAMTTRLTQEVIGIPYDKIDDFIAYLAKAGLTTGGTGSKVRPVVSCKGTTCQYGLCDTYTLSEKIHNLFYVGYRDVKLPHKFKIAVGGCPNNCVKPDLNDLGIIGQRLPHVDKELCKGCKKCTIEAACPIQSAKVQDGVLEIKEDTCNHCGRCIGKCPFKAVTDNGYGFRVVIGGRWGKKVRQGYTLNHFFTSEEEVLAVVEKAILFFREQGITGERFADTIARIGYEQVEKELLGDEILVRKDDIVGAKLHLTGGATC